MYNFFYYHITNFLVFITFNEIFVTVTCLKISKHSVWYGAPPASVLSKYSRFIEKFYNHSTNPTTILIVSFT